MMVPIIHKIYGVKMYYHTPGCMWALWFIITVSTYLNDRYTNKLISLKNVVMWFGENKQVRLSQMVQLKGVIGGALL